MTRQNLLTNYLKLFEVWRQVANLEEAENLVNLGDLSHTTESAGSHTWV